MPLTLLLYCTIHPSTNWVRYLHRSMESTTHKRIKLRAPLDFKHIAAPTIITANAVRQVCARISRPGHPRHSSHDPPRTDYNLPDNPQLNSRQLFQSKSFNAGDKNKQNSKYCTVYIVIRKRITSHQRVMRRITESLLNLVTLC